MYTLDTLHRLPHEIVILILLELPPQYLQQMMRADDFWRNTVDDNFCLAYARRHSHKAFAQHSKEASVTSLGLKARRRSHKAFARCSEEASVISLGLEARRIIQNLFDQYCFVCMQSTRELGTPIQFQNTLCVRCEWSSILPKNDSKRRRNDLLKVTDLRGIHDLENPARDMLRNDRRGRLYDPAQVHCVPEARDSLNRVIQEMGDRIGPDRKRKLEDCKMVVV